MPGSYENGAIDWVEFYRTHGVGRIRKTGNKATGLCPLHDNTRTPALWFTVANGMWRCEAGCGQGNPTIFLAKLRGITTAEAHRVLCDLAGDPIERPRPYDVAAYAAEKGLSAALLASWGLTSARNVVSMPYVPSAPSTGAVRRRHRPGSSRRFSWAMDGKRMQGTLNLYGTFMLEAWGSPASVVLVEGESDCHALWSLDIPALGVPGASTFKASWLPQGTTEVRVHDEGDDGAAVFIDRVATELAGKGVAVLSWATPGEDKDPSEHFKRHGEGARGALTAAITAAVPVEAKEAAPETLLQARGLACPKGWRCDERGVRAYDEEEQRSRTVTATPLVISGRIIDAATGRERVRLEFLRGGTWREVVADRDQAFSSRSVVGVLAPLGAQVTSENARDVVRWLGALEAANLDALPVVRSARELGWCGTSFMPTNPAGLLLDLPPGSEDVVAAFTPRGTLDEWLALMAPHRARNPIFRFMLAAGVAPVILRATGNRIFFVHNWGSSRGGKTAAVKAALSAWGDPEILMTTFNATGVGLERRAALMRDLPLGIDERQAAGGDQRRLDEIVYALASGTGRVRGARDGGLQATAHWRTVVIATGEEPLSGSTSKTGVASRVLEVFGSPFSSEAEAAAMHDAVKACHGTAGPAFVEHVVRHKDSTAAGMYRLLVERLKEADTVHASSHISGVACVCAADVLLSIWLWGVDAKDAIDSAAALGLVVLERVDAIASGDVDETACLWVEDWLHSRAAQFSDNGFHGPLLGDRRNTNWFVYPTPFREALESAGFSYRKTLKALEEKGAVKRDTAGKYTSSQRVFGERKRVIWIDATKLGGERDEVLPGVLDGLEGAPF